MDKLLQYKKYIEFTGKATRSEYWAIYLLTWLFVIVATFLFFLLSLSGPLGILTGAGVMLITGCMSVFVAPRGVFRCVGGSRPMGTNSSIGKR